MVKELAAETVRLLENPGDTTLRVEVVGTEALLDSKKVKEQKINVAALPMAVKLVNESPSFYQQYRYQIWGGVGVLCVLVMGLLISIYFYLRTKRLKDDLERSQADLYEAKDRAEESNRLKSAFLANISHEDTDTTERDRRLFGRAGFGWKLGRGSAELFQNYPVELRFVVTAD